jgi:hypothetical protein
MSQPPVAAARVGEPQAGAGDDHVRRAAAEMQEYVRAQWRRYYPGHAGSGEPSITVTPRHFGFSLILQVDLVFPAGGNERFMIKIRRQQKHGSFVRADLSERILELSRVEFAEHRKAWDFFRAQPAGLSVVRPLDFVESHNAFIVEHAAGEDLSKLVKRRDPIAPAALERCGHWWRAFHHELHRAEPHEWDPSRIDAAVERRFKKLRTIGAPADTLASLGDEIRSAARRVTPVPLPIGLAHGDCKLRHVWATAGGIEVLDFGNAKIDVVWIDPAALIVELSLYTLWTHRMDAAPRVDDMRRLLHAYFEGPPPRAFALYVVDCLLKKWHRRLRSWGPGVGMTRLQGSLRSAGLDKSLERLYIDRWFTTQVRAWLALAEGTPPSWLAPVLEPPCP